MTANQSARARRKRHEEAAAWVLKNRDPQRTAVDRSNFENWIEGDAENRTAYQAAERLMGEARTAILSDPGLRDFKVKPRSSAAKTIATVLVVSVLAGGAFVYSDGPMRLQAGAMSGTGEMPVITLADGSVMQLNAYSAVSYKFSRDTRTVVLLRGEAFFQVAKDANRPFVVEARGARTTALGTAFDVRIGEEATDVTVTEHTVSVTPDDLSDPTVRLEEGEQAVYGRDGKIRDVRKADAGVVLAWRHGQLVVDNVPLSDVVAEISRHFSGHIVIANSDLSARRVSGTFSISNPDAAFALLRESLGLRVTRIGPLVILSG